MNVLVTGGAGFIGSHLADELVRQNYKVIVLDNLSSGSLNNLKSIKNKIKFIKCDLTREKNLTKFLYKVDYVIHLAGLVDVVQSYDKPLKYYKNNFVGTLNILKAAKKAKVKKFIYAASASCYGNSKELPNSEKTKIQILSPYALTKWLAESLVIAWSRSYNFSGISLRFFNVYGPRSSNSGSYNAVINIFIKQKLSNKPFTVVGDGLQTRSFIYVSDVVNAIIKATRSKFSGEIFNIGANKSIKINEIAKILGGKKIHIAKRPGELKHSSANINKVKRMLKWKPKIKLKEGLEKIFEEFF